MKKLLAIIILLIATILFFIVFRFIPNFYFQAGKNDYLNQNYPAAYKSLKSAYNLNPGNMDIRYYYIQTLLKLSPNLDIQKSVYELSQSKKTDSANLIANQQIEKWKGNILFKAGENYIEETPFNDKILRWDTKKFPLKVNIKTNSANAPTYYITQIKNAFSQWQRVTGGLMRFEYTDNPADANILVSINSSGDMKKCNDETCKYTVAYTTPTLNGGLLKGMNINFYDSNNLGQPFSEKQIFNTALHEIGHSLGIMGHSQAKEDLMYLEGGGKDAFDAFRSDFQSFSPRDINTLKLLYKLVPDITNSPMDEFDTNRLIYAPIVMGNEEEINSKKIVEAQNYIKAAPNLPNGYLDLATGYAELNQYPKAIETLNKALELCSNDSERYVVYYNFAVTYSRIKDWENALKYANLAKGIKPDADIDGLIASINFNKGNKDFAKQTYIDALQNNPGNTIDAVNLAIIYMKEFNFVQAGKTLNNLVKANPDAANDPKVKSFGFLMFFFK